MRDPPCAARLGGAEIVLAALFRRATVILSLLSFHISASGKPVHQLHRAVVPDLQPLCQFSNPRACSARKSFQSQHQLMLAGFKSYLANSKLTEVKKASDMVPQIGQGRVVLRCEDFFHGVPH